MLIEAVERRFGTVEAIPADHELEFLSANGGAYIAADTARDSLAGYAADQHACAQPTKQRDGRELCQHVQA